MDQPEDQSKTPAWMYWRSVWQERDKAQFFRLYRLIPAVLTSVAQFIWKRQADASFSDLWIALGLIGAVYLGLFLIESGWRFVVLTPPKIDDQQTEIIGNLHGQISVFQNEPEVSPTEKRRRDQVREQWRGFTPSAKAVVRFVHDRGEVNPALLRESGVEDEAIYDGIQQGMKCGLILHRSEKQPVNNPFLPRFIDTYLVNPSLREALEFVMAEES